MDLRRIVIILLTISISGCATARPKTTDPNSRAVQDFCGYVS